MHIQITSRCIFLGGTGVMKYKDALLNQGDLLFEIINLPNSQRVGVTSWN